MKKINLSKEEMCPENKHVQRRNMSRAICLINYLSKIIKKNDQKQFSNVLFSSALIDWHLRRTSFLLPLNFSHPERLSSAFNLSCLLSQPKRTIFNYFSLEIVKHYSSSTQFVNMQKSFFLTIVCFVYTLELNKNRKCQERRKSSAVCLCFRKEVSRWMFDYNFLCKTKYFASFYDVFYEFWKFFFHFLFKTSVNLKIVNLWRGDKVWEVSKHD